MEQKKKNVATFILLLFAVAALILFAIRLLQSSETKDLSLELENNAVVGILPGVDIDERRKALQSQLDESQIAFSVNTHPVFDTGKAEGNLLLENPANNAKLITAEIVLDDTGETIYQSKALVPGTYIKNVRLDKVLPKGTYSATVYLKAYRQDSQKLIGQTGAAITLAVLK